MIDAIRLKEACFDLHTTRGAGCVSGVTYQDQLWHEHALQSSNVNDFSAERWRRRGIVSCTR
jgi:hypothetical protein